MSNNKRQRKNERKLMSKYITGKVNHLSMNLLVSSLSILIAPFIAIILIYFASTDLLLKVQKEKMNTTLNTTALEITRGYIEAGNLATYISNMKELKTLSTKVKNKKAQYYDMYMFSSALPDYSAINAVIGDVYIFFKDGSWIMKNKSVVPADNRAYESLGSFNEVTYEELALQFSDTFYNKTFLEFDEGKYNNKMVVAQSFPYGSFGEVEGTIVIAINEELIHEKLKTNFMQEEGIALVMNRDGLVRKAMYGANTNLDIKDIPLPKLIAKEDGIIKIKGEKYILSKVKESIFTYVVLIPKSIVFGQVGFMKYLIIALCVVSIFAGFLTCIALWRKRRSVVVAFGEYQGKFGKAAGDGKTGMSFWEGIPFILESAANLQTTILLQRNFMKTAVIRKIILGGYLTEEEIRQDMKTADIYLSGKCYYAAFIMLNHSVMNVEYGNWNEISLSMINFVRNQISIPHQFCNIDYYTFAIIFPIDGDNMLPVIRDVLAEVEINLSNEKHLETYIGIGKEVSTTLEIAKSFEDALEVCEYIRFHDIRMPLSKEEMPKNTETFFFPVETELHLVKTIKQGNQEELKDLFQMIQYENFTYRNLSLIMINYLMELVRGTVIRALREEECDYQKVIDGITEANNLEDIYYVLIEVLPCIKNRQKQKETKEAEEKKEKIRALVEEMYTNAELNLASFAESYGMTENKLYKEFKILFGVSFSEYLENERIKKACELLRQNITIKDVAEMVGYSSDFSFRRAFKRVMGLPPSYYADGMSEQ